MKHTKPNMQIKLEVYVFVDGICLWATNFQTFYVAFVDCRD